MGSLYYLFAEGVSVLTRPGESHSGQTVRHQNSQEGISRVHLRPPALTGLPPQRPVPPPHTESSHAEKVLETEQQEQSFDRIFQRKKKFGEPSAPLVLPRLLLGTFSRGTQGVRDVSAFSNCRSPAAPNPSLIRWQRTGGQRLPSLRSQCPCSPPPCIPVTALEVPFPSGSTLPGPQSPKLTAPLPGAPGSLYRTADAERANSLEHHLKNGEILILTMKAQTHSRKAKLC